MRIELPEETLDHIVQVRADTEERLQALGPSSAEMRTLEDGRRVQVRVHPAGALDLALGLADSLWELYLPHFGSRLMDLAATTQWHFKSGRLFEFVGEVHKRIKEHKRKVESQPRKRTGRLPDHKVAARRAIVEKSAAMRNLGVCKRLDLVDIPRPVGWPYDSYVAAYRADPQKVHNLFNTDRNVIRKRATSYS